jgi:hypothetical protein
MFLDDPLQHGRVAIAAIVNNRPLRVVTTITCQIPVVSYHL